MITGLMFDKDNTLFEPSNLNNEVDRNVYLYKIIHCIVFPMFIFASSLVQLSKLIYI